MWRQISSTFWSPSFWLPENITWADVAPGSRPNINYADCKDLFWLLPMAIVLFSIRYFSEKYIFSAFGQSLGIKSSSGRKRPTPNRFLEMEYTKCNRLDESTVMGLTKQMDTMTKREIERWWRLRRAQDKPTTIRKFSESSWRCLYYTCSFSLGLFVLWDKPWLWDIEQIWIDYPHHSIDNGSWFYLMVSLSLYLKLSVTQFFDVERKDFWMMFAHHIAAILSISFSWIGHLHHMGSVIVLCHDFPDIFLEAGKMAKYAKYQKLSEIIMILFVIVWIGSRLVFYPQLVFSTLAETFRSKSTVLNIVVCLLLLLQCMHIIWTYLILKMAYIGLKSGGIRKDCRSSSDSSESDRELSDSGKNRKGGKMHKQ